MSNLPVNLYNIRIENSKINVINQDVCVSKIIQYYDYCSSKIKKLYQSAVSDMINNGLRGTTSVQFILIFFLISVSKHSVLSPTAKSLILFWLGGTGLFNDIEV